MLRVELDVIRSLLPLSATLVLACASQPPVDDVLTPRAPTGAPSAGERPAELARLAELGDELDARARTLRARCGSPEATTEDLLAAAEALFHASELRSELSLRSAAAERPPEDLEELWAMEDDLREPWRSEMASLAEEGVALADRALQREPSSPRALHWRAMHLATEGRTRGTVASVLAGLGPRLAEATRAAVEADPELDAGGPLVLRGRFLDQAPWPYGDRNEALTLLTRAAGVGPTLPGLLFLGDALARADRLPEAREAWTRALHEDARPTPDPLLPVQRWRATLRLALTTEPE